MGRARAHRRPALGLLMAKKQIKTIPSFAIVWYDNEEEWAKVKAASTDPEKFEASYEEWVAMVEDSLAKYAQVGIKFQKVPVQAKQLAAWCMLHGKPCDSGARAQYVTEFANAQAKADS